MSVLGRIKRLFDTEQKAWTELDTFFSRFIGASQAKTGQVVSLNSAIRVATVLACARVMSEDVAAMPYRVVREGKDGFMAAATDHPLYRLMEVGPNDWQTGFEFRETMMFHLMLTGNAFAFKNRVRGRLLELLPFEPNQVKVVRDNDRVLSYEISAGGETEKFSEQQIWHVRGPSVDTYLGLDIVHQAREAIGLAMAAEETHARLHKNGVSTSGVYSVEGALPEDDFKRLNAWIAKTYAGMQNSGRPMILDRSAKWIPTTMSGVDSEHLATRDHQIQEICRAMRVIPIMVGYSDKTATYASAEQMFIAHNNIVGKWCRRIDNSGDKHLLLPDEYQQGYKTRHQINALVYADTKAKAAWYTALYMIGAINPNEIRGFEHMKPYPEGDQFRVPVNMVDPSKEAEVVTDSVQKMVEGAGGDWQEFKSKLTSIIKSRNDGTLPSPAKLIEQVLSGE